MIKASRRRRRQGPARRLRTTRRRARASAPAATRRKASFGDDRVFIEKFIEEPRHIEIQVLGDAHGNVVYLRRARVLDPAPAPEGDRGGAVAVPRRRDAQGDGRAGGGARARRSNYQSAGTVEFVVGKRPQLLLPGDEHAAAGRASGDRDDHRPRPGRADDPRRRRREAAVRAGGRRSVNGWAIECRINAEDPFRNFLPSTGRLVQYHPPPEVARRGARRHRRLRRRRDLDVLRLDDRQARSRTARRRDQAIAPHARRAERVRHPRRLDEHRLPGGADAAPALRLRATSTPASSPRSIRKGFHAADVPHDDPALLICVAAAIHRRYMRARRAASPASCPATSTRSARTGGRDWAASCTR